MKAKYIKRIVNTFFILLLVFIALFFVSEFLSNEKVKLQSADVTLPEANSRVLVFAPHNDDEVLGSGEFISKSIKNGALVKVVMITNGDGFKQGIQFDYLKLFPKATDYIAYGYTRQNETLKALRTLGLTSNNVTFLGYPDGGISSLWNKNWDSGKPYTSSSTGKNRTVYTNSFTMGSIYTGKNLTSDIEKIISTYKPDYIVFPHPEDHHPDHWATNAFVKYVLAIMNYKPKAEWLYLVHRGDWPTPLMRDTDDNLVPPSKLLNQGTAWYSLKLSTNEIKEKRHAISTYKSQISILGPLLVAFERRNELLGIYPNINLGTQPHGTEITPQSKNLLISDPAQDDLKLRAISSADIIDIYGEISENGSFNLFVKLVSHSQNFIAYQVNLLFINGSQTKKLSFQLLRNRIKPIDITKTSIIKLSTIKFTKKGDMIKFVIPHSLTGSYNHIFLNTQTEFKGIQMDKTAWRMLDVNTP